MRKLYSERLRRHQQEQFKYLRLVFNDNFMLAFIVLMGAVGFGYSNFLGSFTNQQWWGKPVFIIITFLSFQAGRIATLLEDPDSTFLLAKENDFYEYFKRALSYSIFLPILAIALISFLLSPFAFRMADINVTGIVIFAVSAVISKMSLLNVELFNLYNEENTTKLLFELILLASIVIATYSSSLIYLVVSIVLLVISVMITRPNITSKRLQWQKAISLENQRIFKLKRFYNLFTDVPGVSSKIKRRKWLDFLYSSMKLKQSNTYFYIFVRGFVRNNEYIGLFIRLTIIQGILLAFIDNFYISLIVEILFIYLLGFQLKPYFKEIMQNMLQRLYPISKDQKIRDFIKLSTIILSIQWLISAIAIFVQFSFTMNSIVISLAGLVVLIFVNYFYMPRQLKKI
ncbi:ABC transporter permease [Companilactobacillus metriopterae]|uniref:ABC transporter permease n=1 Tax=Companilactobacillus metriopterae TaxID=1909267 RepID=UPI00100B8AF6|nr:ABC transporter permease [Companilactobacillus metriopterae]